MKIEQILELIESDKKIDYTQLDSESLKIPEQVSKYQQLAHDEAIRLRFLEKEYNVLRYKRWMYYMGKSDPSEYEKEPFDHKVLKSDINIYLEADQKLNELQDKLKIQEEKLKLIVQAAQTMQNKSSNIKNALEHQKFMGGAF